jgi:hypothetical protein
VYEQLINQAMLALQENQLESALECVQQAIECRNHPKESPNVIPLFPDLTKTTDFIPSHGWEAA